MREVRETMIVPGGGRVRETFIGVSFKRQGAVWSRDGVVPDSLCLIYRLAELVCRAQGRRKALPGLSEVDWSTWAANI